MDKTLSEQICELCGIEPKIIRYECSKGMGHNKYVNSCPVYTLHKCKYEVGCRPETTMKPVYTFVDFEKNNNKIKLINLLIENDHIVTMSKNYYTIGNGSIDFVEDFPEHFSVEGNNLLEALYNYLTRWIKEQTRFKKPDGTMSEYIDTSHTLEREDCYYPEEFDKYLEDIEKIKEVIKKEIWEF